jgi:signal transduction histidine kinase
MNSLRMNQGWGWCLRTAALWFVTSWACWAADLAIPFNHFSKTVFVDESQQLDFLSAQQAVFQPLDDTERLSFTSSVVWLKLEEIQPGEGLHDWYVKFLPSMLSEATVYTSSATIPGEWDVKSYTANELALPIELGPNANHQAIYMRLRAPLDFRMNLMVDVKAKIDLVQRRIDMFVIMVTTMTLLAFVLTLIRLFIKFNWLGIGITALSITIPLGWISTMGMLPFMTGMDQQWFYWIFPLAMIGGVTSLFFTWMVLATQLFKDGRWVKYLWIFCGLLAMTWAGALVDSVTALRVFEPIYLYGQWICFAVLVIEAWQSRRQLKLRSEVIMLVLLLLVILIPFPRATNLFKPFITPLGLTDIPMVTLFMLVRTSVPLGVLLLTAWSYDLLVSQRVRVINTQLVQTQDALDKETSRLHQQKQFIAMLTHELKNPLMASAMALSSIRQRMGADDPSLQRVDAIHHSLDEIDGIIERCSEIDKYEQGYIPVAIEPVTLGVLMSVVKNAQTSERIYTIVRGCDDHLQVHTDLYYLKAILGNLLSNALKYSLADSLIEFKVEMIKTDVRSELVFTVSNEVGVNGVPDAQQVFQRYYRAEMAKQQSGAGLGLWLAQSMARALGSQIHFQTQSNTVSFQMAIKA